MHIIIQLFVFLLFNSFLKWIGSRFNLLCISLSVCVHALKLVGYFSYGCVESIHQCWMSSSITSTFFFIFDFVKDLFVEVAACHFIWTYWSTRLQDLSISTHPTQPMPRLQMYTHARSAFYVDSRNSNPCLYTYSGSTLPIDTSLHLMPFFIFFYFPYYLKGSLGQTTSGTNEEPI